MGDVFELASERKNTTYQALRACILETILLPLLLIVDRSWYTIILVVSVLVFMYSASFLAVLYKRKSKLDFRVDFSKRILTRIKKKKNVDYDMNFLIEIKPGDAYILRILGGEKKGSTYTKILLDFGRKGKVKIKTSYDNFEDFFSKLVFYCKENEITINEEFSCLVPVELYGFRSRAYRPKK